MRRYMIMLMIFIFLTLFAQGKEEAEPIKEVSASSSSIKMLIKNIKSAKASEKRVLMNQLKVELRKMNQNVRKRAMRELRSSFSRGEEMNNRRLKYNVNHRPHRHRHRHNGQQGGKR